MKVTNIILKVVLCLNIGNYYKTFNDHFISHKMFTETATSRTAALKNIAVAIWPVTGQGFQNTKWPAVLYYQ